VVRLRPAGGDKLIVQLAWQRQVGKSIAVHVAHLFAPIPVFDATEPVRHSLHPRPGRDLVADQLTSSIHVH
jgi:hypothetical protein